MDKSDYRVEPIALVLDNLVDAQQMHVKYPTTFEVPSDEELAAIKPGDSVKICRNNERFWTLVISREGDKIHATVDNSLVRNPDLPDDALVTFNPKHVFSIWTAEQKREPVRADRSGITH